MKKRALTQNKQFHALCNALGLDANDKVSLVKQYTMGRETSSSEMYVGEMKECLIHLNNLVESSAYVKKNKMRRKIIALLCRYDSERFVVRNGKPDMSAILAWLLEGKYLAYKGISFNDLSVEQLQVIITQIEKIYMSKITANRGKMKVVK